MATASSRRAVLRAGVAAALAVVAPMPTRARPAGGKGKRLAYLVSDLRIPFWDIMWRGIRSRAEELGYDITVFSAENNARDEFANVAAAIRAGVDGILLSPTNSAAAAAILKLAKDAGIPVVIADIGTDGGDYVSYISSDNRDGAYRIGRVLAAKLKARGWQGGRVGIVAIPQKRDNGQARTAGFMQAMDEAGIKGGGLRQQVDFSYRETFEHARDLLAAAPDIRAIWLQGSDRYQGALDAIAAAGREGQVLLVTFDAEPEFLDLIPRGVLAGAGMQQPFLMGEMAVATMDRHLRGMPVEREQKLPVLAISDDNIEAEMQTIRRNVLGMPPGP